MGNLYFTAIACLLLAFMFFGSQTLATLGSFRNNTAALNPFFKDNKTSNNNDSFFAQNKSLALETPDLKIVQGGFIYGISTPQVLTAQTLGSIFGETTQERKDVQEYIVQAGDTIDSVAQSFNLSANTIMWANNLSKGAALKTGQELLILPFNGVLYAAKNGDTLNQIAKTYKASVENIIIDNNLANETDLFIGDILLLRDAVMPLKPAPVFETPLAGSSWIYPLLRFRVTQGLHFFNAVDISSLDGCGAPVYAVAAGVVQRAGYDRIGGNRVIISHLNGTVSSYYGHLRTILVVPGQKIVTGTRIGLEGDTGRSTGCHVHFSVNGAKQYVPRTVGTIIDVTK